MPHPGLERLASAALGLSPMAPVQMQHLPANWRHQPTNPSLISLLQDALAFPPRPAPPSPPPLPTPSAPLSHPAPGLLADLAALQVITASGAGFNPADSAVVLSAVAAHPGLISALLAQLHEGSVAQQQQQVRAAAWPPQQQQTLDPLVLNLANSHYKTQNYNHNHGFVSAGAAQPGHVALTGSDQGGAGDAAARPASTPQPPSDPLLGGGRARGPAGGEAAPPLVPPQGVAGGMQRAQALAQCGAGSGGQDKAKREGGGQGGGQGGGSGRYWTDDEHQRFIEAMIDYGLDYDAIAEKVLTRNTAQVRSHSQKFLKKLLEHHREGKEGLPSMSRKKDKGRPGRAELAAAAGRGGHPKGMIPVNAVRDLLALSSHVR